MRLPVLTALKDHISALALALARLLPPDSLPLSPPYGASYLSYDQILPNLPEGSVGGCLFILLVAIVTYAVALHFGAARNLGGAGPGDRLPIILSLRSAARSGSLRAAALTTVLFFPLASFSWRMWNIVDYHLSMMNAQVVNNVLVHPTLADGVGIMGRLLVYTGMVILALLTSVWWVDRQVSRLAVRNCLSDVACGACGYPKQGRDCSVPCPECGDLSAPIPSATFGTATLVVVGAMLVASVTMGPLLLGLAIGFSS